MELADELFPQGKGIEDVAAALVALEYPSREVYTACAVQFLLQTS